MVRTYTSVCTKPLQGSAALRWSTGFGVLARATGLDGNADEVPTQAVHIQQAEHPPGVQPPQPPRISSTAQTSPAEAEA